MRGAVIHSPGDVRVGRTPTLNRAADGHRAMAERRVSTILVEP